MVTHAFNPSTWEEERGSDTAGQKQEVNGWTETGSNMTRQREEVMRWSRDRTSAPFGCEVGQVRGSCLWLAPLSL